MKAHLDKLKRIERLQKRLHDVSLWRLAALAQQREGLAGAHEEMLDALGHDLMASGGPAAAGTRRVRALEVEIAAARIVYDEQSRQSLELGARARLAERAAASAAARHDREREKASLAELIAWTLQPANSGSRKP